MPPPRTHEQNRALLCTVCWRKGKDYRVIIESQKTDIAKYVYADFLKNQSFLPTGLCTTCRLSLASQGTTSPRPLPPGDNFHAIVESVKATTPTLTRASLCSCRLCEIAREKRSTEKECSPVQPPEKASCSSSSSSPSSSRPSEITVCGDCFHEKGPGKIHPCTREAKVSNLQSRISPNTMDRLCSAHLRIHADASGQVTLKTGGRPMVVTVESAKRNLFQTTPPISVDKICEAQSNLNLSNSQVEKLGTILRGGSRNVIEPNLRKEVRERGKLLENFFEERTVTFTKKSEDKKFWEPVETPVVFVKNINEFVDFIFEKRGGDPQDFFLKFGLDAGGGFLKFCLNIIQKEDPRSPSKSPQKKKASLSDSGVKKLFILGIGNFPENYENIKTLLRILNVEETPLDFFLSGDLKAANLCLGLQNHRSIYCCLYCEAASPFQNDESSPLRTLGSIRKHAAAFEEQKRPLHRAKEFKSVVNSPLFNGENSQLILDLIPPPEVITEVLIFFLFNSFWPITFFSIHVFYQPDKLNCVDKSCRDQ